VVEHLVAVVPGLLSLSGTTDNGVITLNGTAPNGTVESNLTFDGTNLRVTGNATITGNLTVSGTTTSINTVTLSTNDSMITLTGYATGSGSPINVNSGIEVVRNASATRQFYWSEANSRWTADANFRVEGNVTLSGTIDTGIGATEVYLMNQNIRTTDSVTFAGITGPLTGNSTSTDQLNVFDTRSSVTGPQTGGRKVRADFLANSTDGLSDGGTYHGVLTFQQWGDSSGGGTRQLGFTDNDKILLLDKYGLKVQEITI